MVRELIRNQLLACQLRVRIPCPPLCIGTQVIAWRRLWPVFLLPVLVLALCGVRGYGRMAWYPGRTGQAQSWLAYG